MSFNLRNALSNAFVGGGGGGATLAANTFTGAQVISANGAASTPALSLTGTIFTGGSATTTKPQLLIEPTGTTSTNWNTAGTMLGCNAPSGFAGSLLNLQRNGTKYWDFQAVGASESFPTLLCGTAAGGLSLKFNNPQLIFRRNDTWDFLSVSWTDVCVAAITKIGFNGSAANMSGGNGTCDAFFARSAAAHIKMGALHATTPTDQTFSAHNVTTGTGAALTLAGGTGSVAGGVLNLATSATTGAPTTHIQIKASGVVNFASASVVTEAVTSDRTLAIEVGGTTYKVLLKV